MGQSLRYIIYFFATLLSFASGANLGACMVLSYVTDTNLETIDIAWSVVALCFSLSFMYAINLLDKE